jgi:hypothetical protein
MTTLDLLPPITRFSVAKQDPRLRPDLLVIPEAEADGWTVKFEADNWNNTASFQRGRVTVWWMLEWRSMVASEGLHVDLRLHGNSLKGLREALKRTD